MENMITILTRFVADAVWCCAVVLALSLGCAVVWKWQDLAEGLKGEPKTFRAVFVTMLVAAATLFSKVDPNGAPPNLKVDFEAEWKKVAVRAFGYKGVNFIGVDF